MLMNSLILFSQFSSLIKEKQIANHRVGNKQELLGT